MSKVYSIITPSMHSRRKFLDRLLNCLQPQMNDKVEHIILIDGGEMSLGTKMNLLYSMVHGKYVGVVNDDDMVAEDYIERILEAAECDDDAIMFRLETGFVEGMVDINDFVGSNWDHYENVMPAKTELVRKYTKWNEDPKKNYEQDSGMAATVRGHSKSVYIIDKVLYYHMRQK